MTPEYTDSERHYIGKDLIEKMRNEYPAIQFESHTYDLHYETEDGRYAVDTKSYEELDEDFKKNKEFGFEYLAYPYGQYSDNMIEAAKNNGIRMAFAFREYVSASRESDRFTIPRIKINGQITLDTFIKRLKKYIK